MNDGKHNTGMTLVALLGVVVLFVSVFAFLSPEFSREQQAGVGAYAGVERTELNTLTQQITEKELELQKREEEVAKREAALEGGFVGRRDETTLVYATILGLLLLALILLNFIMDARRSRRSG